MLIRFPKDPSKVSPKKRGVGKKAGLTKRLIVETALRIPEAQPLGLAQIAKKLGVTPAAVGAHFEGGLAEIMFDMARKIVDDVTRSPRPGEDLSRHLRRLFDNVGQALVQKPRLALAVGWSLSTDHLRKPRLVEAILVALVAAGIERKQRVAALELVLGGLIGFVGIAFPRARPLVAAGRNRQGDDLHEHQFPHLEALQPELARIARPDDIDPAGVLRLARRFGDATAAGIERL